MYKFDAHQLVFTKVKGYSIFLKTILQIIGGIIVLLFFLGISFKPNLKNNYTEQEVMIIMAKYNQFSEKKLMSEIKSLNFKFPHIVYAQAELESGKFTSKIFIENHNLFGMRESTNRNTTATGVQNNYSYYPDWEKSLIDYALYSSKYLSNLNTEEEYYEYLAQNYAKDKDYIKKLTDIVENKNLKDKFIN